MLQEMLNAAGKSQVVDTERGMIHYLFWPSPAKEGIIFIHGGGAHAHWWDFIAPAFLPDFQVAAMDLPGMGDSDWRQRYDAQGFAQDIFAVASDAGMEKPVLVCHSFGGLAGLSAAVADAEKLSGLVVADTSLWFLRHGHQDFPPFYSNAPYPRLEDALKRFRLVPDQPICNPDLAAHIAKHSLRKTEEGWQWKFDPLFLRRSDFSGLLQGVPGISCPLAFVYGEKSCLFPPEAIEHTRRLLPQGTPFFMIEKAHHHLFLDEPLAFVSTLKAILASWPECGLLAQERRHKEEQ